MLASRLVSANSVQGRRGKYLKGLVHDLFTISFYPKVLYNSSMKPSLNRTTVFKLIVHGIELRAAFEERENKHFKILELSFFFHKIALVMQFCGKRKITLNNAMFANGSWQWLLRVISAMFIVQFFPKCLYIFGWLSVEFYKNFMSNNFCKQTMAQSWTSPFINQCLSQSEAI